MLSSCIVIFDMQFCMLLILYACIAKAYILELTYEVGVKLMVDYFTKLAYDYLELVPLTSTNHTLLLRRASFVAMIFHFLALQL